jgi:hypothetical protein
MGYHDFISISGIIGQHKNLAPISSAARKKNRFSGIRGEMSLGNTASRHAKLGQFILPRF